MKISTESIRKIKLRVDNLNLCLSLIPDAHPSDITCAMGASLNSLLHILDDIDFEIKKEKRGWLNIEDLYEQMSDKDLTEYENYRKEHIDINESDLHFYNRKIEEINLIFKTKP